jgi:hypothetical protein
MANPVPSIEKVVAEVFALMRPRLKAQGIEVTHVIAEPDCTTAICMPAGTRLRLDGLDKRLQRALRVGATEKVVMIRLPFRNHTHRDGVRFTNGREVMLQDLNLDYPRC